MEGCPQTSPFHASVTFPRRPVVTWFINQSLLFIVIAFLLGLLVGYLWWGRQVRRIPHQESSTTPAIPQPLVAAVPASCSPTPSRLPSLSPTPAGRRARRRLRARRGPRARRRAGARDGHGFRGRAVAGRARGERPGRRGPSASRGRGGRAGPAVEPEPVVEPEPTPEPEPVAEAETPAVDNLGRCGRRKTGRGRGVRVRGAPGRRGTRPRQRKTSPGSRASARRSRRR